MKHKNLLPWLLYKSQEYDENILEILDRCSFEYHPEDAETIEKILERYPNAEFPKVIRSRRSLQWLLLTGILPEHSISEALRESEIYTLVKRDRVEYFFQLYRKTHKARESYLIAINAKQEKIIDSASPMEIAMKVLYDRVDTTHVTTVPFHEFVRADDPIVFAYCHLIHLDIEDLMPIEESKKCFDAVKQFRKYISFHKIEGEKFSTLREVFWVLLFRRAPKDDAVRELLDYKDIGILRRKKSWGKAFFSILKRTSQIHLDTMTEMLRGFRNLGPNVVKQFLFKRAEEFSRHNEAFVFTGAFVHDSLVAIPKKMHRDLLLKYPHENAEIMRRLLLGFAYVNKHTKSDAFAMEKDQLLRYAALGEADVRLSIETYEDEQFLELVMRYGSYTRQSEYSKIEKYWIARLHKGHSTIPYVRVEHNDFILERLSDDDPIGMFLGYLTGCCQHLWGAAETCAVAGVTEPTCGFWVVRQKTTMDIKYQSFVWTYVDSLGEKVLVVDSIEGHYISQNKRKQTLRILYMMAATESIGKLGIDRVELGSGNIISFSGLRRSQEPYQKIRCNILNRDVYSADAVARTIMVTRKELEELKELAEIERMIQEEDNKTPDHQIIREIEAEVYPSALREMQECLTIGRILQYASHDDGQPDYKISQSGNTYMIYCVYPQGGSVDHYSTKTPFIEIVDLASRKGYESESIFLLMSLRHQYLFSGYKVVFDARSDTSRTLVELLLKKYKRIQLEYKPVVWDWDSHTMWRYVLKEKP